MSREIYNTEGAVPLLLFGVPLHNLTFKSTLDRIDALVAAEHSRLVATANLDFHRVAAEDPEMQRILFDADIMMADGFPMVKLSGLFGPKLQERVTGSDITPMLAEHAAEKGLRLFFLGAAPGVAQNAAAKLMEKYPGLNVVGCYSPEKADVIDMQNEVILQQFEETRPDVLLVAFGAPKQEKWIQMHRHEWQVPVAMGIGGSFDFIAGAQLRSPVWMQKLGLEWLGRLLANPKRLAGRYLLDATYLVKKCLELAAIRLSPVGSLDFSFDAAVLRERDAVRVAMKPLESLSDGEKEAARLLQSGRGNLVVIPERTGWLNSVELGVLVYISRICREEKRQLVVCPSSRRIRRLLYAQGLHGCFSIATSSTDAVEGLHRCGAASYNAQITVSGEGSLHIDLPVELTSKCGELPSDKVADPTVKAVIVDASQMHFIDCAGIARLVKLKARAEQEHIPFTLRGVQELPAGIIRNAGQQQLLD